VLLEPLDVNAIGRGIVAGVTPVKVIVDPDHLYDFAEMEPGNTLSLRNAPAGSAQVLWLEESGSTERWAVVRLGDAEDVLRFQLLESLSRCGAALAKTVVFQNGKWCPVEVTFTVHDSIGVVCPDLCKGESTSGEGCDCPSAESVPAGTFGLAKRFEDSRK